MKNQVDTYRDNSFPARLDDFEGRLDVLEFFADGRAKCSGDELWDDVKNLRAQMKKLRMCLAVSMCSIIVWIGIDLCTTECMYQEQEKQIDDLHTQVIIHQLEVESLKKSLKCITDHSYKITEARDSL